MNVLIRIEIEGSLLGDIASMHVVENCGGDYELRDTLDLIEKGIAELEKARKEVLSNSKQFFEV